MADGLPKVDADTVENVDKLVECVSRLKAAIDSVDHGPEIIPEDRMGILKTNIEWAKDEIDKLTTAKDTFKNDSGTLSKVEGALSDLTSTKEQMERMERQAALKANKLGNKKKKGGK